VFDTYISWVYAISWAVIACGIFIALAARAVLYIVQCFK
jgi:hypothetical protein